jgi:Co/Zn/Cd efflux system component
MAKLVMVSIFAICFMITELIGGALSDSLAILTDAAH